MNSLRKILFVLLLALLLVISAAALADTVYSLSPAPAEITLKDSKVSVLTSANVDGNLNLLSDIGISKNDLLADFESRGVVLQAWSPIAKKYTCMEITVTRNDFSTMHPDMISNPDDRAAWKSFETAYTKDMDWSSLGYKQLKSNGKKRAQNNYYLQLEYYRKTSSGEYRGYMAVTTYQGYVITVDYQAYNQALVRQHEVNVYNAVKTIRAAKAATPVPESAGTEGGDNEIGQDVAVSINSVPLDITVGPPAETNTNTFTIEGTTQPGAHVIGVLMPISFTHSLRFEADADAKKGAFKIKVTLPEDEETTWLMTLNVLVDDKLVAEHVFDTTLYKKILIPVTFDNEVPETWAANELTVSGTTLGITEVQCLVTSANDTWEKKIRTDRTGVFNFKIPMKNEGEYSITLSFTKKGSDNRHFRFTVSRYLTDEARNAQIRKDAKRESYGDVAKRTDQYVGQTLCFRGWVTAIDEVGDEWRITVAGAHSGEHYSQYMVWMAAQEPSFAVGEVRYFYGRCIGPYQYQSEEGTDSVPSFDLLVWD